jgi:hypothetical protein
MDGGAHNIRVFRNRCFNVIAGALSATPLVGGPAYLSKVTMPDRKDIQRLYSPGDLDFSLAPGSVVIDAGTALPTIRDGYSGRAPDLGALERGRSQPHYGPCPVQSATK